MSDLLFLTALIPLLVLTPSLSYASVTPEQDKCIQDKLNQAGAYRSYDIN